MSEKDRNSAEYYDEQAEANGWRGPEVIFGLMYRYVDAGESVLDVGVGTGLGSELFHRAGLAVSGMDSSPEMLEGTRAKGIATELRRHDMTLLPYPYESASFDHVICIGVLQFFEHVEPVLGEMSRLLRAGGWCGLTVVDAVKGEPTSVAFGREHTGTDRGVTMYRHRPEDVRATLAACGFEDADELVFVAFMDAERTMTLPIRAYVARRRAGERC